jgi:hypothetical protein
MRRLSLAETVGWVERSETHHIFRDRGNRR